MKKEQTKDQQESNSYTLYADRDGKLMAEFRTEIHYSFMAVPYKAKVGVLKYKPKKKKKK